MVIGTHSADDASLLGHFGGWALASSTPYAYSAGDGAPSPGAACRDRLRSGGNDRW